MRHVGVAHRRQFTGGVFAGVSMRVNACQCVFFTNRNGPGGVYPPEGELMKDVYEALQQK
jgi:hypothetical protein